MWEYRETDRLGRAQTEKVVNAHRRLTAIIERLGGAALANYGPAPGEFETKSQATPRTFRADETVLRGLKHAFWRSRKCRMSPTLAAVISRRYSRTF
ncbi:hypothetical protein FHT76_007981 [Rhizobium sp. BK176]|nr:hypothetical protein [Rhizobium sp. BK181]MCS4096260.1 hypothetical protein [Rhizobium sp. BK176]